MAEVEITQEEVRGIDINQVASMQLNDGTVVVVKSEEELAQEGGEVCENCQEGEFAQEELAQEEDANQYAEGNYEEQANDLRARPMMMMARPMGVPVRPVMAPMMVPPRPIVPHHHHRGPVRPMGIGYGLPLRARPGMPLPPKPVQHYPPKVVAPPVRPVVPVVPGKVLPASRPVVPVAPMRPAIQTVPMKGVPVPVGYPIKKPLVNQMVKAPGVFRSRPNNAEEEQDFQEENAGEEQYCECDEQQAQEEYAEESNNQLRARPLVGPMVGRPVVPVPVIPKVAHHPPRPVVAPVRAPVVPMVPKRGPVVPVVGYNTYQPRVFRARPGYRPVAAPMLTPVTNTFKPLVPGPKHHPNYARGPMRPMAVPPRVVPVAVPARGVFRNRPKSAEEQEYAEEYQQNVECNKTCVCSKCGKEF